MKKVLIVGAEAAPFAKTGGLADVIGTLPKSLISLGYDARVILPYHRVVKEKYGAKAEHVCNFDIYMGWRTQYVGVKKIVKEGVTFYFIDNEFYFGDRIYLGDDRECEQYCFFTRAVLEALSRIGFIPDVVHCNDWHTAMIPMLLRTQYGDSMLANVKSVFTIHNMMYQGKYSFDLVSDLLAIEPRYYNSRGIEAYGGVNFMKAALVFSDKISTVSPTYADEIKFPYYGYGMDGLLRSRSDDLVGILNGIDMEEWNPETDKTIACNYGIGDIAKKQKNKEALIKELGLTAADPKKPLIGIVSRLTQQKGFDLVTHMMGRIMDEGCSVVLLGSGDAIYERFFRETEAAYKGRFCAWIGYDDALSHKIYAASDLFLMPSKFEPCGISQMIALRYGSLPIVRETGGLKDTVQSYNAFTGEGTGFSFTNYNAHDMINVIRYALETLGDEQKHKSLVSQAMSVDNSFAASAKKYVEMYESVVG